MVNGTSRSDVKNFGRLISAAFAECLGTMMIVFFSCGSATEAGESSVVRISLTFAFTVATMVLCTASVSGGHLNPAVTAGMVLARRISVIRAVFYIIFQCAGGIAGAFLLQAVVSKANQKSLGATTVSQGLTMWQGCGMELIITFILVMTVFAITDTSRKDLNGSGPLAVGLAIGMGHLLAVPYTGAGMNPARSLGPALATGIWENHWVYWLGPIVGGLIAALMYDHIFAANSSIRKTQAWCLQKDYDNDNCVSDDVEMKERC